MVTGCVPVHAPAVAVSVAPARAGPSMAGAVVLLGATGATGAVVPDAARSMPPSFAAVTTTRMACPRSSAARSYVRAVAPAIGAQPRPAASQRSHWYAKSSVGVPTHSPGSAVSV